MENYSTLPPANPAPSVNPTNDSPAENYSVLPPAAPAPSVNPVSSNDSTDTQSYTTPAERLNSARERKLARLTARAGYGEKDRAEGRVEIGGYSEDMRNKIINDYTPAELEYLNDRMYQETGVVDTEEGLKSFGEDGELVDYTGDASTLSSFYTMQTPDGKDKYGIWGGLDSRKRIDGRYGDGGILGANKVTRNRIQPNYTSELQEALRHGNKTWMKNRVARYDKANPEIYLEQEALYGTGVTEIYNPMEIDRTQEFNREELWTAFNERFRPSTGGQLTEEERAEGYRAEREAEEVANYGTLDRLGNAVKGGVATFASELLVNPADLVVEALGGEGFGNEEEKTKMTNDWIGYKDQFLNIAMKNVEGNVKNLMDAAKGDKEFDYKDVAAIAEESFSTPELITTSIGSVLGMVLGFGKFTKVGGAVLDIEKAYKAGKITKDAAKVAIKKTKTDASLLNNASTLAARNAGFISVVSGRANNTVEAFAANNEGEVTFGNAVSILAVETGAAALDRIAGAFALRDIPLIKGMLVPDKVKALKEIVKTVDDPKAYTKLAKGVGKLASAAGGMAASGAGEFGTEYLQTLAEVFNEEYASKKFGDDFSETLFNDEAQLKAFTGAAVGLTSGAEMTGIAKLAGLPSALSEIRNLGRTAPNSQVVGNAGEVAAPQSDGTGRVTNLTNEELDVAKKSFVAIKKSMDNRVEVGQGENIPTESMGQVIEQLAELDKIAKEALGVTPEEAASSNNASIVFLREQAASFIENSEDGKVSLTRTPTVSPMASEALDSVDVNGDPVTEVPTEEDTRTSYTAEESTANVNSVVTAAIKKYEGKPSEELETKLRNFAKSNNVNPAVVEKLILSYASVDIESTVGDRGVVTRSEKIEAMLSSGTMTTEEVQKEYDENASFYASTQASIDAINQGVVKAKEIAATMNKSLKKNNKDTEIPVETTYKTSDESTSKGAMYKVMIRREPDSTKWVVDTKNEEQLISRKKDTLKGLSKNLDTLHQRADSYLDPDKSLNSGGYIITQGSATSKKAVETEITYVASVKKSLGRAVSKVILGEGKGPQWDAKGSRARTNAMITNVATDHNGEYTSSDVVYVHAKGTVPSGGKKKLTELKGTTKAARTEILAAISAGSTIVLANDHRKNTALDRDMIQVITSKGYIRFGISSTEKNIFVPDTEANALRLAEVREADAEATATNKEASKAKTKAENDVVTAGMALEVANTVGDTEAIEIAQTAYDEASENVSEYYSETALRQAIKSLKEESTAQRLENVDEVDVSTGDKTVDAIAEDESNTESVEDTPIGNINTELLDVAVTDNVKENINRFVKRRITSSIKNVKETRRRDKQEGKREVEISNPNLESLVEKSMAEDATGSVKGSKVLAAWRQAKDERADNGVLATLIDAALNTFGIKSSFSKSKAADGDLVLGGISNDILTNSVGNLNKADTFNVTLRTYDSKGISTTENRIVYKNVNVKKGNTESGAFKAGDTFRNSKLEIIAVNEITHNPNNYVNSGQATPLNTLEVSTLPKLFKDVAASTGAAVKKLLTPLSKEEKGLSQATDGISKDGNFYTLDSPSRTFLYDQDGKIHESVALAIGVAIRGLISTDKRKLLVGPKDAATVAAMLGVTEGSLTDEQMKFARDNGAFSKSVADSLGKSVMQILGMSRKKDSGVNMQHYERLLADVGNVALYVAEAEGLLKIATPKSNDLAKLIKNGEVWTGDKGSATTSLVTIPHVVEKDAVTKIKRNVPNSKAAKAISEFTDIDELVPDALNKQKGAFFGKPLSKEYQKKVLENVRNDFVGGKIPGQAKKALKGFMNTAFSLNMEEVKMFMDALDNEATALQAKKLIGFVEISDSNPEYAGLLYDEKIIQESTNETIEKSIKDLRKMYDQILNKDVENEMYFGYYYSSNHRYNLDSNTINPQNDKLHRFFVQPQAHKVTYKVDRSNHTFEFEYKKDGVNTSIDSSLYVRAALGQAFGIDIDKEYTENIIAAGNYLLSRSAKEAADMKDKYLKTGKITVLVEGDFKELEPDHPSHALQGIQFLLNYTANTEETMTSSLSAEFDALTSGFSNKVQQFGTLEKLNDHANRVAVIRSVTGNVDKNILTETYGVNDMLADPTRQDSYKNLASMTIEEVGILERDPEFKSRELFNSLKDVLPGGTLIGQAEFTVDKALRALFKPAFMIFNYSASIARIKKNLGEEMITEVLSTIAKAGDLNDPANAAALKAASALAKELDTEMTPLELQQKLRDEPVRGIKIDTSKINDQGIRNPVRYVPLIPHLAERLIEPTYGKAVEKAFELEFKDFIEIQNTTNDMFAQAYAVFNQSLMNKIKKFKADGGVTITDEDFKGMIDSLRPAFPVIAGPLSSMLEEGIHVYDTDTKSPNEIVKTGPSPQTKMVDSEGKTYNKVVNPLVKSMIAAANAGAVLPFHAIDGAQMATTANDFAEAWIKNSNLEGSSQKDPDDLESVGSGILPVHDAIIPPLPLSDMINYIFNRNTVKINKEYSIMAEIVRMSKRIEEYTTNPESEFYVDMTGVLSPEGLSVHKEPVQKEERKVANKELTRLKKEEADMRVARKKAVAKEVTDKTSKEKVTKAADSHKAALATNSAQVKEQEKILSFARPFIASMKKLDVKSTDVNNARAEMYNIGTQVGTMVGTPGSVYTIGGNEQASLKYLENPFYSEQYENVDNIAAPAVDVTTGAESNQKNKPKVKSTSSEYNVISQVVSRVIGDKESVVEDTNHVKFVEANQDDTAYTEGERVFVAVSNAKSTTDSLALNKATKYIEEEVVKALEAGSVVVLGPVAQLEEAVDYRGQMYQHLKSIAAADKKEYVISTQSFNSVPHQVLSKKEQLLPAAEVNATEVSPRDVPTGTGFTVGEISDSVEAAIKSKKDGVDVDLKAVGQTLITARNKMKKEGEDITEISKSVDALVEILRKGCKDS